MEIKSPVTYSSNITRIRSFDVEKIKALYLEETRVDVSRFFNGLTEIELYRCNDTGYRFYFPFTIYGDDKFYQDLHELNSWYYQDNRWEHPLALSYLKPADKILEIGSGDGFFIKLCKKNNINDIKGLELNTAAAAKATQEGNSIINETIQDHCVQHAGEYDVVCNFQVLEHIVDIRSFMESSLAVLKKGGKMIIAVPNNNPYLFEWDDYHTLNLPPHHAGLWNKETFKKLETVFGIKNIHAHTEPLGEMKHWFAVKINHLKKTSPLKALLLSLIPGFMYKSYIKNNRATIEGRNILMVFEKP
ncbi:MAG: methyltransferase domain-containing protein [Chitinophagaceae bacterium]|nr:methyltransferase domain-containing protein [Chitinophagaceae bacterium]